MNEKQLPDQKAGEERPVQRKRRLGVVLLLTVCVMLLTCASAFATGGESGSGDSGMTSVISSIDTLSSLLTKVWTLMTGNPYLTLFLALSLLSAGFGVFRRAKRTARR